MTPAGKAHKKFTVPALGCTAIDDSWLPGAWPVLRRLLWHVAMHNFHTITGAPKMFAYLLGDHDGTVLSAGTAERNGQIALAFMNVVREQVDEQIGDARDELPTLGKRANVFGDARIASRQRPELGYEVRVRQEAHVKDEVGVLGNALTEPETDAGHQNVVFRRLLLKTLGDVSAELMNVEFGSIDD